MLIVLSCSLIALLFTFLESEGKMKYGMRWGFILVTFLGCIHYDYGNDYMSYYGLFKDIVATPFDFHSIMEGDIYREPGWVLMCYLFGQFGGFFVMVAVLNIIQNVIIYRFVRNNVAMEWRTLAVFIYLFTTSLYLMNFSMMRQSFVACVFLALWPLIKERKWWVPLGIILLCSFVHSSSVVLLPFTFFGFLPIKKSNLYAFVILVLYLTLWFNGNLINDILFSTMSIDEMQEYVNTYGMNTKKSGASFGIGFILYQIPLFVTLYYLFRNKDEANDNKRLIVVMASVASMIAPFAQIMPMIGRLSVYFTLFSLASMSYIYSNIIDITIRKALLCAYILMVSYDYILFFDNPIWVDHYSIFHTIFEAL